MPIWTDYPTQTTPDDADTLLAHDVSETVVGDKMKRTTWANIKAALKVALASATPTASTIPIADAAGKLAVGWMPDAPYLPLSGGVLSGTVALNNNGIFGKAISIADDTVFVIVSSVTGLLLFSIGTAGAVLSAIVCFRASSTPGASLMAGDASLFAVGATALTDGTGDGVDGKMNIYAYSDGNIYIKNRMGAARSTKYTFIA